MGKGPSLVGIADFLLSPVATFNARVLAPGCRVPGVGTLALLIFVLRVPVPSLRPLAGKLCVRPDVCPMRSWNLLLQLPPFLVTTSSTSLLL